MRVLVVGSYPPAPGPEPAATLESVRAALRAGHDVRVLSPEPGAAHEFADVSGLSAAAALLRRSRSFDALVLHIEPGLPIRAGTGRMARMAHLAAIGLAAGRYRDVTVHLDDPYAIPGSVGGRAGHVLWRNVHHVSVRNDADRDFMHELVGVPADRITVRDAGDDGDDRLPVTPQSPARLVADGELGEPKWHTEALTATEAMAEVRARAAAKRAAAPASLVRRAATPSVMVPSNPPPGVASVLARRTLKRALGDRAPAVGAAVRKMRARLLSR